MVRSSNSRTRFVALGAAVLSVVSLSAGQSGNSLSSAIQSGNRTAIRTLLRTPANVKAVEPDGTTPLHWAARVDDLETARALVKAGVNPNASNRYGATPLSLATVSANPAMVEMLLAAGANPNAMLGGGQTALMTAARTGNPTVVKALLAKGADPNIREKQLGETALMWAAAEDHADVVTLLVQGGAKIDARSTKMVYAKDRFGLEGVTTILPRGDWTAMFYAARDGGPNAVRALARAGAEVNVVDPDGTTPLVFAIMNSHYDAAGALLEMGADPNILDTAGMGALYAAVDMSSLGEVYGLPPRKVADKLTALDIISRIIKQGGVVNARLRTAALTRNHTPGEPLLGTGTTPLMRAARHGDFEAMKILLAAGADPTLEQPNGTNALIIGCGIGRGLGVFAKDVGTEADLLAGIRLLLDTKKIDVNKVNTNGLAAVHIAAQAGLDSLVSLLAERGAKLDLKDKQGRTPEQMAMGVGGRGRAGGPAPVYEKTAALLRKLQGLPEGAAPASGSGGGPGPAGAPAASGSAGIVGSAR
jgi:ankyrin repeat protein